MDIDKVIMVLNHKIPPIKNRMMMMTLIYDYTFLFSKQSISSFLLSELPNINVTTWSVRRPWPIHTASITFQDHHLDTIFTVKTSHIGNSMLV